MVQQYLVREDGKWRVATGDSGTINRFLASNPAFRAKFPIRQPRVYVKQGNNWVEFCIQLKTRLIAIGFVSFKRNDAEARSLRTFRSDWKNVHRESVNYFSWG